MKAKVVEKVKFAPGKWKEAGELMKTFKEAAEKQGFPPIRIYGFISGGDVVQTLNFVTDWDSLGAMETVMDKMFSDPEMREMMEKWAGVVESHEVTILKELSPEELGM
jgi:ABC-type glycerol-3-phosphate transport system substrate-binding protein